MMNPEYQREQERMFLRETARETVLAFDLDAFFAEAGDFDAHIDTIAGYLDTVIIPDLIHNCENKYGVSPGDPSAFFEEFRKSLIAELNKYGERLSTKQNQKILNKLVREIKSFDFVVSN